MNQYIEQNKRTYNQIASKFSQTRDYLWDELTPLAVYVQAGGHVLDLGCGNGRLFPLVEQAHAHYLGYDQSEGLIAEAKKKFPHAEFVVGDMVLLPFDIAQFDTVMSIAAFHHLPDDETRLQCLSEIARVLKSDGVLVMTNWNADGEWIQQKLKQGKYLADGDRIEVPWKNGAGEVFGVRQYWHLTMPQIEQLCQKAGFGVVEQYYTKQGQKTTREHGANIVGVFKKLT